MSAESKHTETPWQIGGNGEVVASVDRLFGAPIEIRAPLSSTSSDSTEKQNLRSEENAAFIVRACNAHDDLAAALKVARSALQQCAHVPGVTEQAIWSINEALSKAGAL